MGDITISGGGMTAVATDRMLEDARTLNLLARAASTWQQSLESSAAQGVGPTALPTRASHDPWPYLLHAQHAVCRALGLCTELAGNLDRAAEAYGRIELAVATAAEVGGSIAGYALGASASLIGLLMVASLPSWAVVFGGASLITGSPAKTAGGLSRWLAAHRGILRNPVVVSFVRQAVSASDSALLGAAGVPYPVARAFDDGATGLFGLRGAAGTVVALAGPRALKETPVTVSPVTVRTVAPASAVVRAPVGFRDLADRVPASAAGGPQVRIERYDVGAARPHWVVYVAGTVDLGLVPGGEPWDDTSNVNGVAGLSAGSIRATEQALVAAGAVPGDAVLPVGYSQGGIAATSLATGGAYSTPQLVTFGSPTGGVDVPSNVTDVAVEHRDDLIPALGGNQRSVAAGGADRVLVERTSYDAPPPLDESPLVAHSLSTYAVTATQMDASSDPRLVGARNILASFTGGNEAQVSLWRGERVAVPK
ncbi:MAG: hypothetical protein EPN48_03475 [Microbacteriaceae bacterium]|nr:MAG: hypothetical protein EPN48_03475 [Microbacteriaceae bacterium]